MGIVDRGTMYVLGYVFHYLWKVEAKFVSYQQKSREQYI